MTATKPTAKEAWPRFQRLCIISFIDSSNDGPSSLTGTKLESAIKREAAI
jgi:hypothetical protein